MKVKLRWPVAALLAITSPAAMAAEGLDCMDASFSEEQQAVFQQFAADFEIEAMDDTDLPEELTMAVAERADFCTGRLGWSEEAVSHAIMHYSAGLLDKLVIAAAPFSAKDWRNLRTAYQTVDKAMVRQLVEPPMEGREPDRKAQAAADLYFGAFFARTGIAESTENAQTVGVWLGAQGMLEISAERFAAN